jgi:valine--pyruvate aminotransferase
MRFRYSSFGQKALQSSGIGELMEDMGQAMNTRPDLLMLGGGNPAHIPAVEKVFRQSMQGILSKPDAFEQCVGNYDGPQGNAEFLAALAEMLAKQYGWKITAENIALTNGSQSAFSILFSLFAGDSADGVFRKILLPLTPEYIGYADIGFSSTQSLFASVQPKIEYLPDCLFKYHVDFEHLAIGPDIGAVCVSRPTNPTGNVLTDDEIAKLRKLTQKAGVPLIIDSAYGTPFPAIEYEPVTPAWDEDIILCLSLSKLGLPGVRTGIVIATTEVIRLVSETAAVTSLAPGSMGPAIVCDIVRTGRIVDISETIIRPYYQARMQMALDLLRKELDGLDFRIHKPEGAFFLWLWLKGLPIHSKELYQRLKQKGVLIISGHYFFPGLETNWPHKNQCIRITYSQKEETVRKGIEIITHEIREVVRKK